MSWKRVCKVTDVPENGLKMFTVDGVALVIILPKATLERVGNRTTIPPQ